MLRIHISSSRLLVTAIGTLLALGVLCVYAQSAVLGDTVYHDSAYFLKRHLLFLTLGGAAFVFGYAFNPLHYPKIIYGLLGVSLALLAAVLIPGVGHTAGGAARWIALGPLHLQAGEICKITLVIYLAYSLAQRTEHMKSFKTGFLPQLLAPACAMTLLLLEPDFGTTMMIALVTVTMLFIAGVRMGYLLLAFALSAPVAWYAITSIPYRLERVKAFLDPWSHRQDSGYQVVESLIALGSGKLLGTGIGEGTAKLFFLPAVRTDFILAGIGEELGFMGVLVVICAFLAIGYCGFQAALKQKDPFLTYLAAGLTTLLLLQACINAFVVMGLLPTKGITLPFVSYGGSSLLVCMLAGGILLRLCKTH